MAEQYGSEPAEWAYLSRFHAMLVNSGYRGKFTGVESVDSLFALLRRTDRGASLAELFMSNFGDGGNRTSLVTIRIADPRAYELVPLAKRLADEP